MKPKFITCIKLPFNLFPDLIYKLKIPSSLFAFTLLLALIHPVASIAQTADILDKKISIETGNTSLANALKTIGEKAGCSFSYSDSAIDAQKQLSVKYNETSVREILYRLLGSTVTFQVSGNQVFIRTGPGRGSVKGNVQSNEGKPVILSTVVLKGSRYTTQTDTAGNFRIDNVPAGRYTLEFSAVAYDRYSNVIQVTAGQATEVNIVAQIAQNVLDEITVTGNRPVVTSSSEYVSKLPLNNMENSQVYTGITNTFLVQQKVYNVNDAVSNVPGITIVTNGYTNTSDFGGSLYTSRGFGTKASVFNGLSRNMYSSYDVSNLEKIEVIKGPSATLFGNAVSSYGGLINRVTKKPYEEQGGSVDFAGGGFGFHRVALDLNTPLNRDKSFLSRINVGLQNQNTFQDNGGYMRNLFIAPAFTYKLSDRVKVNLNTELNLSNYGGTPIAINFSYTPSVIKGQLETALKSLGLPPATIAQVIATAPSTIKGTFGSTNVNDFKFSSYRNYGSNDLTSNSTSLTFNPEVHYTISRQWKSVTSAIFASGNSDGYALGLVAVPNSIPAFLTNIGSGKITFGTPGVDYLSRLARKYVTSLETYQIQQNFVGDFNIGRFRNRMVVGLDFYHRKTSSLYKNIKGSLFGLQQEQTFDVIKTSARHLIITTLTAMQ